MLSEVERGYKRPTRGRCVMNAVRLSRIATVAAVALFFLLVAIGNVTDYGSNFQFVRHVLSMDTTFNSPNLMWRAITAPALHHAAYVLIIAWEILTALLLLAGTVAMWRQRSASRAAFVASCRLAILGLTAGF